MTLIFLCIVLPTAVLSSNNIDNLNVTAEFLNMSKFDTFLIQGNQNLSSTVKYTTPVIQTVSNLKNQTKPKFQNKNKSNGPEPIQIKFENKAVKPIKRGLEDMPLESDLEEIMDTINKVLDFFMENKNEIDISLNYGLFLLNVNLRTVLKHKRDSLPSGISYNLKHILAKNEELLNFFKSMVERDINPDDELSKSLTTLFNHERLWMSRIQKFDGALVNKTVFEEYAKLEHQYSHWDKYVDDVGDFNKAVPRPDQSDRCLSYLANNHANRDSWKKGCQIPVQCRKPLAIGTDYGYGLTHRLLYLQLAYYGYRCYVFSNKKDEEMREEFCKKIYAEATYISLNEYGVIDLFVEQLCLCALDGHYQFLHRSWLLTIISFQTDPGCFSDVPLEKRPRAVHDAALRQKWMLDKGENQYILGGLCNVHTSSAAVATLGFGVKFILEAYY